MNVNTFEEQFGDKCPTCVLGEFKKEISSNIANIVVLRSKIITTTQIVEFVSLWIRFQYTHL